MLLQLQRHGMCLSHFCIRLASNFYICVVMQFLQFNPNLAISIGSYRMMRMSCCSRTLWNTTICHTSWWSSILLLTRAVRFQALSHSKEVTSYCTLFATGTNPLASKPNWTSWKLAWPFWTLNIFTPINSQLDADRFLSIREKVKRRRFISYKEAQEMQTWNP